MINLIVSVDSELGLGNKNKLLFKDTSDLSRFKKVTMGNAVVMGRSTSGSISNKLVGRKEYVVSSTKGDKDWVTYIKGVWELIKLYKDSDEELWVIGGAKLIESIPVHYFDNILITYFNERAEEVDTYLRKEYCFPYKTHYIYYTESIEDSEFRNTFIQWRRKPILKKQKS